jgi:hypothetical protein
MNALKKKRVLYALLTLLLIAVEVFIALYVHDGFVRPYVGDMLVVIVCYTFVRIFFPEGIAFLPLYVFIFAVFVEILQYFKVVKLLGLEQNTFFRVLIGSVFDFKDIGCYGVGCLVLAGGQWVNKKHLKKRFIHI